VEESVYEVDARIEQEHWWHLGRRKLFGRVIGELGAARTAPVLDIGTSAGTNLRLLRDVGFTDVTGLDFNEEAVRWCAEKGLGAVRLGSVTSIPFEDASFSLILATDIVEHVDDDTLALSEIRRVLRPGAAALITVPAFPSLWGLQDEVSHHRRRYRLGGLLERIRGAGLEIERSFHFNYLLFAPIWAARQVLKRWRPTSFKSEGTYNSPLINKMLGAVFDFDVATAQQVSPPFGVSILAVARRPAA